jgi:hypothetical protein
MNTRKIRINLKDLDKENLESLIRAFYELPEPASEEYTRKIDELRDSLYFNLGHIELYVVYATGLDIYENETSVLFDEIN